MTNWQSFGMSFVLGALIGATGCSHWSSSAAKRCPFVYDQTTIDTLIIPSMKARYGDDVDMQGVQNPTIVEKEDSVKVAIDPWPNELAYDKPHFIIVIDRCSRSVTKSYQTSGIPY